MLFNHHCLSHLDVGTNIFIMQPMLKTFLLCRKPGLSDLLFPFLKKLIAKVLLTQKKALHSKLCLSVMFFLIPVTGYLIPVDFKFEHQPVQKILPLMTSPGIKI